jgi:sigma-B regulation protein RsbQ
VTVFEGRYASLAFISSSIEMTDIVQRNNVTVEGDGPQPMLFAHGFGCDQTMWRFVAPHFADDYQTVLFDYVGAGESDLSAYDPDRYDSLDGYAQDVLDVCEALDLTDVIFVGHSVSTVIGMLASIDEPDRFDRLVLVGTSPCYLNDPPDYHGGFEREDLEDLLEMMDKNYIGWSDYFSSLLMQQAEATEVEAELDRSFCSTDPHIMRQFAEATFFSDYRDVVPEVHTPSLMVECADDIIAPMTVTRYMEEHLPDATLEVLDAAGHCPHMSHPRETTAAIDTYLHSSRRSSDAT